MPETSFDCAYAHLKTLRRAEIGGEVDDCAI